MKAITFDEGLAWMRNNPGKMIETNHSAEWYFSENDYNYYSNGIVVKPSTLGMLKGNLPEVSFYVQE